MCFLLQHRRVLYDMFNKNYRIRRNALQVKLSQELGDVPKTDVNRLLQVRAAAVRGWMGAGGVSVSADVTCRLLFQECCISHAGMWYLNGTLQS